MAKTNSKSSFVNTRYAKSGGYKEVLEKIEKSGKCPFCPENRDFKNPILKRVGGWIVKKNDWPYKNTLHHFVFIPDRHLENFSELTPDDFKALLELVTWTIKEFKIPGGGFAMRFGEPDYTGASVRHLHAHLIVPELNKDGTAKVAYFPIG